MKRLSALALCAALLLTLCACAPAEPTEPSVPSEPSEPTTPAEPGVTAPAFTAETMPRLDGSTATIPLSEGLAQALLGYTPEQAAAYIHHNTTHNAYVNLLAGEAELIFVTPPSAEELAMMEDSGVEYDVVRVTLDGFVFLVNAQNPVESVSLEQLRAVYRGEITSWSELGGDDVPIIPYQRPDNSGSQTLMYKLVVPADEIADAPEELRPASMGGLVDVVSAYDGGAGALGYSVYYYASGMYVDEGSRLLGVDGVLPTDETIHDGSYPLVDGYYAVLRHDAAADSPARLLLDYLLSPEGQQVARAAGYVV